MNLYIMSRGRAGKVKTWENLSPSLRQMAYIVVSANEYPQYARAYPEANIHVCDDWVKNYSDKFEYILEDGTHDGHYKCVIMDDDLRFATREGDKLLAVATKDQLIKLEDAFFSLREHLDHVPLASFHPRMMAQDKPLPYVENGKVICMQAINREAVKGVYVKAFPILADVALNLWVLSRGLGNRLLTDVVLDFGSCQAPGGCSLTRTAEMQKQAVQYYAALYDPYFKEVRKKPKGENWLADEEGYRTDFRCQWKKLNEDAPYRIEP